MKASKRSNRSVQYGLMFVLALLLVLVGCSKMQVPEFAEDAPLITNADLDAAELEEATTFEELIGSEEGEVLEGEEIDLLESFEDELSTQATLPDGGADGFIAYVMRDTSTAPWKVFLANQANDAKRKIYEGDRETLIASLSQSRLVQISASSEACTLMK